MLLRMIAVFAVSVALFAQTDTAQPEGQQGYGGPSILSRGLLPSITARNENLRFRPSISVSGICDTGLTAVSIDAQGHLPNLALCGVELSAGVYGHHRWKRTSLGLTYTSGYRHYTHDNYYDGTDQSFSIGVLHRLSKRASFALRGQAGISSRSFLTQPAPGIVDTASLRLPAAQLFDNQVEYATTAGDLTLHMSPRWSMDMGTDASITRYRSNALFGATTEGVRANVAYRYSRSGSIGAAYSFAHYHFTKSFGASDLHTVGLVYSLRMSRYWEFRSRIGVARIETLGLQSVSVDPVIAAITGQTGALIAAYHLTYVPDVDIGLSRAFHRGSLGFAVSRSSTAGNGVYLTSTQDSATVSYSYVGLRHWNLGVSGGYTHLKPLVQSLQPYHGYSGGFGLTRDLGRGLQAVMRADGRRYDNGTAFLRRDTYRVSLGFGWSPGDVPLSLW